MAISDSFSQKAFPIWSALLALIVFPGHGELSVSPASETNALPTLNSTKVTVELLVVCDKDFSEWFHHDRQKIIDYWAAQMWDVNMKFKTLKKTDITFKIHQLIAINNTNDQPFIEEARIRNGSVRMLKSLNNFSKWAAENNNTLINFDIAIVATTADKLEKNSSAWSYGTSAACKHDPMETHLSQSVVLFHFRNPWDAVCGAVSRELANVLGAPSDWGETNHAECKWKGYLRDNFICGRKQYFFSKCSDEGIADYIKSSHASCLHHNSAVDGDVITSHSKVSHPPSIDQQCKLMTGNNEAVVAEDRYKCIQAACVVPENGRFVTAGYLYPFDNSPCDDESFCFRGRCLQKGYQLRHVQTGNCLHSSDHFSSNDTVVLESCAKKPTPLDQFMILDNAPLRASFLAMPYSSLDASENEDKCLGMNSMSEKLQFRKCSFQEDSAVVTWKFIEFGDSSGEFLLFHPYTDSCVAVDENLTMVAYQNCGEKIDISMFWKFDVEITWEATDTVTELPPRQEVSANNAVDSAEHRTDSVALKSVEVFYILLLFSILI